MTGERLFKFLEAGGSCPITGTVFPLPSADDPGAWLVQGDAHDPDALGFLVCRAHELAHFACAELYEVEVDGNLSVGSDAIIAERMRLVRRHADWPSWARELCALCLARAQALTANASDAARVAEYVADVAACVELGFAQGALFVSAKAHACVADPRGTDAEAYAQAFARERNEQCAFIAARLAT